MVKPLTERGVLAVKMRAGAANMESMYADYPPGFSYTHEHPLPRAIDPQGAQAIGPVFGESENRFAQWPLRAALFR